LDKRLGGAYKSMDFEKSCWEQPYQKMWTPEESLSDNLAQRCEKTLQNVQPSMEEVMAIKLKEEKPKHMKAKNE
jgi:hypothetical protein